MASKAQDSKQLIAAFSQSYLMETNKNYLAAIAEIQKVHNDRNYETTMRLAWLYYASEKYKESVALYQKAIDLMPASIEPKIAMVTPLVALNNWDKVISNYQEILKISPNYSLINYRLGLIYYNRENYPLAKKYFDINLNLFPFDFETINMSAWTAFRLGKTDIAKALFNKALLVYPANADCLEGLKLCK
jgi:tetratricopeptide (TPR) repeat protein